MKKNFLRVLATLMTVAMMSFLVACPDTTTTTTAADEIKYSDATGIEVTVEVAKLNDHLQLKGTTETNAQAASLVATGYTPLLIGGITMGADAANDAAFVTNFWNTNALKMTGSNGVFKVKVPKSYIDLAGGWGGVADTSFTVKVVFVKDALVSTIPAASGDAVMFTDAAVTYVYSDAAQDNGVVTLADLNKVNATVVPTGKVAPYDGVSIKCYK